ncbi:MAG TPA: hypothetical protein VFQ53_33130 [Kofleriaceae bacterium]|nr:hypothetical protein [Kofleriaceae bacterium]
MKKLLVAATVLVPSIVPMVALAQPAPPPSAPPSSVPLVLEQKAEPTNSINLNPLGALVGDFSLTYEHLFNGHHGLIVEGLGSRSSGDEGSALQFGGGVGYRWHWRGRQNSGFLGVMVAQRFGSGTVTLQQNGVEMEHDMSVRSTTVTANIGKRWMLTDAVNVTFRIGAGWGHHVATAKEDTMEAKEAENLMNDILTLLPIGLDGELSLGYAF